MASACISKESYSTLPLKLVNSSKMAKEAHIAIFLLICHGDALAWQFALLPDRHKSGAESQGDARSQEESAGIQANYHIYLA
jgi:hypothetical protein